MSNAVAEFKFCPISKNELIIAYHIQASGEIRLSEEPVEFRLI